MIKYGKEVCLGFIPVLLLFLVFMQINIIPFLFVLAIVGFIFYMSKMRSTSVSQPDRGSRAKSPAYLTFDDIGGQERAKKELMEALEFLIKHAEYQKLGIRALKGVLLTGPPGTGKTLMAKASAHYTNSLFISSSGSEFVEMYVGVGASRIREMFKEARTKAVKENKENAIIFIDEIDVIGGKREGGQHREYDQTLNQLLTEMDGIHTDEHPRILIIAATNRKDMLDSALLRPGRFDRHIQIDLPDRKGRNHILKIHANNKPLHEEVILDKIAEEAFGFSGAQLESIMNEAAIYAMREESDTIAQKHLSLAIDKVMMGEKTDREITLEEKQRVAIHELGHAIVAELVSPGAVSQVSLTPRGQALGYVRHNPQNDQYLYTKEFLEQQIMIALGGSVAEVIYYGDRSTGSRNDFEQSLQIVRTMIDSGLTSLGIVNMSMLNKQIILKENQTILDHLTEETTRLLEYHKAVLDKSLTILLKEEVLSGNEFRRMLVEFKEAS